MRTVWYCSFVSIFCVCFTNTMYLLMSAFVSIFCVWLLYQYSYYYYGRSWCWYLPTMPWRTRYACTYLSEAVYQWATSKKPPLLAWFNFVTIKEKSLRPSKDHLLELTLMLLVKFLILKDWNWSKWPNQTCKGFWSVFSSLHSRLLHLDFT